MEKPQKKASFVIICVNEKDYWIEFWAEDYMLDTIREFGRLSSVETRNPTYLYVDRRYDIREIEDYLNDMYGEVERDDE